MSGSRANRAKEEQWASMSRGCSVYSSLLEDKGSRSLRRHSAVDLWMAFAHRPTKLEFLFWPILHSIAHSTLSTTGLSFLSWNAWIFYIIIFEYKLIYIFGNKFISVQMTAWLLHSYLMVGKFLSLPGP